MASDEPSIVCNPGDLLCEGEKVVLVVSRYNQRITTALENGAVARWMQAGRSPGDVIVVEAAGAWEVLSLTAAAAAPTECSRLPDGDGAVMEDVVGGIVGGIVGDVVGDVAGVVALGCIVKGQTMHDEHLGRAVTDGLARLMVAARMPIGLGVLTVNTIEQARVRAGLPVSGDRGDEIINMQANKGYQAMEALLATISMSRQLASVRKALQNQNDDPSGLSHARSPDRVFDIRLPESLSIPDKTAERAERGPS